MQLRKTDWKIYCEEVNLSNINFEQNNSKIFEEIISNILLMQQTNLLQQVVVRYIRRVCRG